MSAAAIAGQVRKIIGTPASAKTSCGAKISISARAAQTKERCVGLRGITVSLKIKSDLLRNLALLLETRRPAGINPAGEVDARRNADKQCAIEENDLADSSDDVVVRFEG
jgi:hypothetical protein